MRYPRCARTLLFIADHGQQRAASDRAIAICVHLNDIQKQASVDQAKAAVDAVRSEMLAFCAGEEQPYFTKTACTEDTTLEQMADKSRITNDEKVALSKVRTEGKKPVKKLEDMYRLYYPQLAPSVVARVERSPSRIVW
jgi:hypothetical protein